ncbi:MAG: NnrS family protein [Prosthecobacter sp.]|uniref:NnrS family protein n=1 Tax=Prosthecobacter sp. TaxID=1965333 RepID=UPI003902A53F
MSFPTCKHRKHQSKGPERRGLRWLASEPYRVFFFSGAVWSIIGVSLWPLFYAQQLGFYPNFVHARLMIEAFGGAFVIGFLGTAGPRMASAPKLTPLEMIWLFMLHQASAISHLRLQHAWGDGFFIALLVSLLLCLVMRVVKFRKEAPPPQMFLALTGLACGIAGAAMLLSPATLLDLQRLRLANLLLYQGLLLPPVLGIGSFVFPRMLGGDFGDPKTAAQSRTKLLRAIVAAMLLVSSFFLEAFGQRTLGYAVRVVVASVYLLLEVNWKTQQTGSLTTGLFWALGLGLLGIALPPLFYPQHVSVEHLLYIGGFGLLILVVASRVLFGHSGDLDGFFTKSKWVRFLVFLAILAATTRATPAWVPSTTVSHHIYAAWTWGTLALLWLIWHRQRFVTREAE